MDEQIVGRVVAISIYPVRSLGGRELDVVDVTPHGLAGDRDHVVVGTDGAPLRSKDAPQLADVAATGDPVRDTAAVRAVLARPVELAPTRQQEGEESGFAPVHLVSRGALERAAAGEVPEGCSAEDPRANLLLDLGVDADPVERTWVGALVTVGEAVLRISRTPKHCLGVYAEVRTPGRVAVGDAVRLRP